MCCFVGIHEIWNRTTVLAISSYLKLIKMNPGQTGDVSINSQITKYEEFIEHVLKGDLQRIMNNYEAICEKVVEYTNIKSTIKTIQDNSGGQFKTMSDIGSNCYVKCVV